MTALTLTATLTRSDGAPLDELRIARILSAFAAAAERHGCTLTVEQDAPEELQP